MRHSTRYIRRSPYKPLRPRPRVKRLIANFFWKDKDAMALDGRRDTKPSEAKGCHPPQRIETHPISPRHIDDQIIKEVIQQDLGNYTVVDNL